MTGLNHQTVRIARGRHESPAHGACVMELASMLGGEEFTDRPRCVDRVVAAYMRALNDRLGDRDRQRLVPYASACVGTRGGRARTRRRMRACLRAAGVREPDRLLARLGARGRLAVLVGLPPAVRLREGAAGWAARELVGRGDVAGALRLLEDLIGSEPPALPVAVAGVADLGGSARADLVAQSQRA